jgi:hypothetical protein
VAFAAGLFAWANRKLSSFLGIVTHRLIEAKGSKTEKIEQIFNISILAMRFRGIQRAGGIG